MFKSCSSLTSLDLSSFNTLNVKNFESMFSGCTSLEIITFGDYFDTSNAFGMFGMFAGCASLTSLDLSGFDTSKVADMSWMFNGCTNLVTVYASELWNTDLVISSNNMFGTTDTSTQTTHVKGGNNTSFNSSKRNKEYARVDDPSNGKPGYFTYKAAPTI